MSHPTHVPPAVLQFAMLELLATTGTPAAIDATEKLVTLNASREAMFTALAELAEAGYADRTPINGAYVITDLGRRLIAPESTQDRIAQYQADGLERLAAGSPRTFPGDTEHCVPGHVRGSKPYIVPTVPGSYVVRHGADYLDRAGRVVTQGTAHELRTMIWAEAEAAIGAHEASLTPLAVGDRAVWTPITTMQRATWGTRERTVTVQAINADGTVRIWPGNPFGWIIVTAAELVKA